MKQFRFSLETVLDYKQQALDSLRAEHGASLAQVRAQEQAVQALEEERSRRFLLEYDRKALEGQIYPTRLHPIPEKRKR